MTSLPLERPGYGISLDNDHQVKRLHVIKNYLHLFRRVKLGVFQVLAQNLAIISQDWPKNSLLYPLDCLNIAFLALKTSKVCADNFRYQYLVTQW